MVFRRGNLVYHNGEFLAPATKSTIVANVEIDANMDVTLRKIWPTHYGYSSDLIRIHQDELLSDQRNIEFASRATKSVVIGK
jgi:hypothetical protein